MAELTMLAKLKLAKPIIMVGRAPVFTNITIAENNAINKDQLERNNKAEAIAEAKNAAEAAKKKEPTEPKKKMTKAEERRERQRLRREEAERQYNERIERNAAERDAAVAAPMPAPAAAMMDVMARLAGARAAAPMPYAAAPMPRAAAPAVAVPALANMDAPDIIAAYAALPQDSRDRSFWDTIQKLNWHNTSDGMIGAAAVGAVFRGLNALDLKVFKTQYTQLFEQTTMILDADGMFGRNHLETMSARARVVSHIIALGPDQYRTLTGDPEILQFLVECGECQSLNEILPEALKI